MMRLLFPRKAEHSEACTLISSLVPTAPTGHLPLVELLWDM